MTGQTVANVHWRALDRDGEDKCRLARVDQGWLLIGHAKFRDDAGFAALDYVLRCDEAWHTLGADISGLHGGAQVKLHVECVKDDWQVNGVPQPDVTGARDIDLSFTPATNLMPLRRLMEQPDPWLAVPAAWLGYPALALSRLNQTYTRTRAAGRVDYVATETGFATRLDVDACGFVTLYPGLWEGDLHHVAP